MNKKTKLYASLLTVGVVAYSSIWYYNGTTFKGEIESRIHSIQQNPLVESFDYESVSMSGFPFKLTYTIHNPKIKFNIQEMYNQSTNVELNLADPIEPSYHISLYPEQSITISTNIIGSSFDVMPLGDIHMIHDIDHWVEHAVIAHGNQLKISLKGDHSQSIKHAANELEVNGKIVAFPQIIQNLGIEDFTIQSQEIMITDTLNQDKMYSLDNLLLHYDQHAHLNGADTLEAMMRADTQAFVKLNYKNMTNYPASKEFIERISERLALSFFDANETSFNTTTEIEAHYSGPLARQAITLTGHPAKIEYKIQSSNQLGALSSAGKILLGYEDQDTLQTFEVAMSGDAHYQPESYPWALERVKGIVERHEHRTILSNPYLYLAYQPIYAVLKAHPEFVSPRLHELGDIHFDINTSMKHEDGKRLFKLSQFDLNNSQYRIQASGEQVKDPNLPVADGHFNINLGAYEQMVDRFSGYLRIIDKINTDYNVIVDQNWLDNFNANIKKFAQAVAYESKAHDKDLELDIVFNSEPPAIYINEKSIDTVQQLAYQHLSSEDVAMASSETETPDV